ncbi:MAG TPA: ATP-binding cassette domain-containing protein, partial [Nocardioides sp.]|nr:ATP-binding cassette domain-containing protein [Nocardioides sp.]
MITVESLTRRYAGFTAVDNVSFTALPGRVTGFLGPNGAGKSTTMRVMVGLT